MYPRRYHLRTQDERLVGSGQEAISHRPPYLPGEAVVKESLAASQVLLRVFCSTPAAPCLRILVRQVSPAQLQFALGWSANQVLCIAHDHLPTSLLVCGQGSWQVILSKSKWACTFTNPISWALALALIYFMYVRAWQNGHPDIKVSQSSLKHVTLPMADLSQNVQLQHATVIPEGTVLG